MRKFISLIMCVLFVMSIACTQAEATQAPIKVLHVGDSLTYNSMWTAMPQYIKAGYQVTMRGIPGSALSIPNPKQNNVVWVDYMRSLMGVYKPDVLVVELGTNDAIRGFSTATYKARVRDVLLMAGNTPVYWVNVMTCTRWGNISGGGAIINTTLSTMAWRYTNLLVVDVK